MNRQQRSWLFVDVGNSAFATTILAAVLPVYFPSLLPRDGLHFSVGDYETTISSLSLWSYTVSLSVFVVLLLSPILGAWSDRSGNRKLFFGLFSILGILGTFGLGLSNDWRSVLISFAIGNIGFAGSNVFYNALLASVADEADWDSLSLKGFAWGYLGGGILLALHLIIIHFYESIGFETKSAAVKFCFFTVSIWWLLFILPALLYLKEKVSVGLKNENYSWITSILTTLKKLPKQPNLFLFLGCFILAYEGIQTVIAMASIYGKDALQLSDSTLIGTLLMIQILGFPFTLLMTKASEKFSPKKIFQTVLIAWIGIVGFAVFIETSTSFWIMGFFVSIILGVSQALPRSIFQSLIPKGQEAEYFSLFALTGKMTSVLGPLIFGLVRQWTGSPQLSLLSLMIFFIASLILLYPVELKQTNR